MELCGEHPTYRFLCLSFRLAVLGLFLAVVGTSPPVSRTRQQQKHTTHNNTASPWASPSGIFTDLDVVIMDGPRRERSLRPISDHLVASAVASHENPEAAAPQEQPGSSLPRTPNVARTPVPEVRAAGGGGGATEDRGRAARRHGGGGRVWIAGVVVRPKFDPDVQEVSPANVTYQVRL